MGSVIVKVNDWDVELKAFVAKIDDFNIRGQRQQVNHPGIFERFAFCPKCGADLSALVLTPLNWTS